MKFSTFQRLRSSRAGHIAEGSHLLLLNTLPIFTLFNRLMPFTDVPIDQCVFRLFLIAVLVAGLIAIWEQIRGNTLLSRFRRGENTTHSIVLKEIKSLGKLELVKYTFKDIVEHEQVNTFLPNANAILIVEGEATGCIDLTKITTADITSDGDSVTVRLPKPELCSWKINHDRSRVYDTRFSFLDQAQLVSDAYKKAESQVKESALNGGILDQTRQNANQIIRPLLERVSGRKIGLVFQN